MAVAVTTLRAVGLLVAASLALSVVSTAGARQPVAGRIRHGLFDLLSGRCESEIERHCAGPEYSPWNAADAGMVRDALDDISRNPLGQLVIERAGVRDLRRYQIGLQPTGSITPRTATAVTVYTKDGPEFIALTDRFFEQSGLRDLYSGSPGYRFQTRILIHELLHALDRREAHSSTNLFLKLVGFQRRLDGVFIPVTPPVAQANDEVNRLNEANEHTKAWELSRRVATSLKRGAPYPTAFPTLGVLVNEREAFSEIGAHLILDPTALSYLSREIMNFFSERVFRQ